MSAFADPKILHPAPVVCDACQAVCSGFVTASGRLVSVDTTTTRHRGAIFHAPDCHGRFVLESEEGDTALWRPSPRARQVYAAEDDWTDTLFPVGCWCGDSSCPPSLESDDLDVDDLDRFARDSLIGAGWADRPPKFEIDISDGEEMAGQYDPARDVIRLHPRLTFTTVLHELAHSLRPYDGHGPQFCAVHLDLVAGWFGPGEAARLARSYLDHGAEIDWGWTSFDSEAVSAGVVAA